MAYYHLYLESASIIVVFREIENIFSRHSSVTVEITGFPGHRAIGQARLFSQVIGHFSLLNENAAGELSFSSASGFSSFQLSLIESISSVIESFQRIITVFSHI